LGAEIDLGTRALRIDQLLFNESQSRIILSVAPNDVESALRILSRSNVQGKQIGTVGGQQLEIKANRKTFRWTVADIYDDWFNSIRRIVETE
jgi:phosphoribosylformylglycinamidine synthase